jgi:hypothetical protein
MRLYGLGTERQSPLPGAALAVPSTHPPPQRSVKSTTTLAAVAGSVGVTQAVWPTLSGNPSVLRNHCRAGSALDRRPRLPYSPVEMGRKL